MLGYDWPRLHSLLNDLPIALLLTAVFFDLLALGTRRPFFRQASFWTLIIGVIGAGAAVLSGLQAEEYISHGDAVHRVMENHERLGLITLGLFGVLAVWRIVRENRMGGVERAAAVVLSLVGVGFVFATGLQGGRLMFEHAAGIPDRVLEAELFERTQGHEHRAGQSHGAAPRDSVVPRRSAGHVDPPGTPPHTHSDPPGTPPHEH
jgi:uncharacterized membrane protein